MVGRGEESRLLLPSRTPFEDSVSTFCQRLQPAKIISTRQRFECQNVFHEHRLRQRQMQITFFRRVLVENKDLREHDIGFIHEASIK